MLENSVKKPPTDFTIDCILSKPVSQNGESQKSTIINYPMNKVLANPWESKYPLSLTYNPSSHRRLNYSSSALMQSYSKFVKPQNCAENLIKVAPPITPQFSPVLNHFYPAATTSTSSSESRRHDNLSNVFKLSVYDTTKPCDKKIIQNNLNLSENFVVKYEIPSSATSNPLFKCSICSKTFENNEILNVSYLKVIMLNIMQR